MRLARLATLRGEGAYAVRMVPHAFNVLAGPQPVDPVTLALAGIDPFPERADLDRVCAAARGSDPVVPERREALVERLHGFNLRPAPPLSTSYLVLVRGKPSLEGRWPSLRLRPALASRVRSSLAHVPIRASPECQNRRARKAGSTDHPGQASAAKGAAYSMAPGDAPARASCRRCSVGQAAAASMMSGCRLAR